jgi:Dolichyl-phosphate-mannose-protein mannosyltransferase
MTERQPGPHHATPRTRRLVVLSLLLALGVFLALGAYQLSLPGLHYDEAREAGLNAMQLLVGQPVTAFRGATVQVGPWQLPLMVQDYIGALNVYLALPFLLVGGINVVALRWLSILTGALTLVLAWRVADRLGGSVAAVVTVALLAVSPTFVFWSRQGIFVTNLAALLFMAGLLSGLRWWSGRRERDLWLTAFLFGLGVYAKLLFVWAIGALVIVALVGRQITQPDRYAPAAAGQDGLKVSRGLQGTASEKSVGTPLWTWILALVCFVVPLMPLILFNLRTGGTLASVFGNLGKSYYGVNNAAYFPNLLFRLEQMRTLLRGDHLWYLGELFANRWAPWLAGGLIAAASVQAVLLWRHASRSRDQEVRRSGTSGGRPYAFLLPLALLLLVVAQSAFTVSDLFITHYALIYPLIPLTGGLAVAALMQGQRGGSQQTGAQTATREGGVARRGRASRILPALVVAVIAYAPVAAVAWWAAADLWTTVEYHKVLSNSGGYSAHSDAVYGLAASLDREGFTSPLALDWGLAAPVRFLTAGRVNPDEVFGYDRMDAPDAGFTERMSRSLDDPDSLYLAHMPDVTVFRGRVDALKALAATRGLELDEEDRFAERSGHPLFVLYRATPVSGSQ